ncbi:MAG: hypothetical protein KGY99_03185 [Phycisphaerae bacterium]|nr:hypothetical protein [Phycisphaerae bacterium]
MSTPSRWNRRRIACHAALYAALLIVGAFAAWQVSVFLSDRAEKRRHARPFPSVLRYAKRRNRGLPESRAGAAASRRPFALDALANEVRVVDADPAALAPPRGATRRYAYRMAPGRGCMIHAAGYDVPGDAEAVAVHYRSVLSESGFEARSDVVHRNRRTLVFTDGSRDVTVILRPTAEKAKMNVTVTELSAPPVGGQDRED